MHLKNHLKQVNRKMWINWDRFNEKQHLLLMLMLMLMVMFKIYSMLSVSRMCEWTKLLAEKKIEKKIDSIRVTENIKFFNISLVCVIFCFLKPYRSHPNTYSPMEMINRVTRWRIRITLKICLWILYGKIRAKSSGDAEMKLEKPRI